MEFEEIGKFSFEFEVVLGYRVVILGQNIKKEKGKIVWLMSRPHPLYGVPYQIF